MKKLVLLLCAVFCMTAICAEIDTDNLDYEQKLILVKALRCEVADNYRGAAKCYAKLFKRLHKVSDKAACKQCEADCWFEANKTHRASEAYRYLVRNYGLYVPFDEVVPKLRELAECYEKGKGTFLWLADRDNAIRMYNMILLEAPAIHSSLADRIRVGELYLKDRKKAEAVAVYQEILKLDDSQDDIRLQMSKVLVEMSRQGDGDGSIRRAAARNAQLILERNPNYAHKDEVELILAETEEVEARNLLALGKFYLRRSHYSAKAARMYLLDLASKYPNSRAAWEGNALLAKIPEEKASEQK